MRLAMSRRRFLLTYVAAGLAASFLLTGCGDDPVRPTQSPPPPPLMNGRWLGGSSGIVLSLTLTQSGTRLSGAGSIAAGPTRIPVDATGGNVHPSVSLTMSAVGYEDFKFGGRFTDRNTVVGTLYGSGFTDFAITLVRQ